MKRFSVNTKVQILVLAVCMISLWTAASHSAPQSETVVWLQDWESGWGDWYSDYGIWDVGETTMGDSAFSGSQVAATNLTGNYSEPVNTRLIRITPIAVPAASENPRIRFYHWFQFNSSDYGYVQVREVGTTEWTSISQQYNSYGRCWTRASLDISDYAGMSIELAFYFHSADGSPYGSDVAPGWYVDDVALVTGEYTFNNPEDWEGGLGDWYADKGHWQVGEPIVGPGAANSGILCAGTDLLGDYDEGVSSRLVSPPITIPAASENPRFRFYHWFYFNASDYGYVQIRLEGETEWVNISNQYYYYGRRWTKTSLDLSDYAGLTVEIAFYFHSADGSPYGWDTASGWFVDDIELVTGEFVFNNPEDWENGLGDWFADCGTWEIGEPASGPGTAYSGVNCAATVLTGNYDEGVTSRLTSPPIEVPSIVENPRLRFFHWFNFNASDYGYVQVRPEGSEEWISISSQYTNYSSRWTRPSFDLSEYAGQTIEVAFYFRSIDGSPYGWDTSSGWYIDDVEIVTGDYVFNNPEDWLGGLGDWYTERGTWEVGVPTSGPGSAHSDSMCAATVLSGNYSDGSSSRITSPTVAIPDAVDNPRLRFYHWFSFNASDYGYVQIRAEGETEWTQISAQYSGYGRCWTRPSIDLSGYAGQNVQLAFYFRSVDGSPYGADVSSGWYVDDVEIVTGEFVINQPEDWENGLGDWYADRGTWQVGEPTYGACGAYSGVNCAATVLDGNYDEGVSSRLVSPPVTLPSVAENPRLRFQHCFSFNNSDYGNVQIRVNGGEWENIIGPFNTNSNGQYTRPYFSLAAYADSTVEFAFQFVSVDGSPYGWDVSYGWHIEDVIIETDETPPSITCPEDTLEVSICEAGEVCAPLYIWFAETVDAGNASWANDTLCFDAPSEGLYSFSVIATNQYGVDNCDIVIDVDFVDASYACFTASETAGLVPLSVTFNNCSTPESGMTYVWDFGDGSETSSELSPTHLYETEDIFTVSLIATNSCGSVDTLEMIDYIAVADTMTPNLPLISCYDEPIDTAICAKTTVCIPLEIEYQETVIVDGATWADDSLCFYADSSKTYIYEIYAGNDYGWDTCSVMVDVTVAGPPVACFTPSDDTVLPSHAVTFTNCSTAGSYSWDFGDGSPASELTSPEHSYAAEGDYAVTLTVTGECGSDQMIDTIHVVDAYTRLYFEPDTVKVLPGSTGESVFVDLMVKDAVDLMGINAMIQFDHTKVEVRGMTVGDFLSTNWATVTDLSTYDNDTGEIEVSLAAAGGTPPGVEGDGLVLTIELGVLVADPTSELVFESASMRDSENNVVPGGTDDGLIEGLTSYLGDFDEDGDIDFADYTIFVSCWNAWPGCDVCSCCCDIAGPVVGCNPGSPPWAKNGYPCGPDGEPDFEDQMVFVQMYNWWKSVSDPSSIVPADRQMIASSGDRTFRFEVPEAIGSGEILEVTMTLDNALDIIGWHTEVVYGEGFVFAGTSLDELEPAGNGFISRFDRSGKGRVEISRAILDAAGFVAVGPLEVALYFEYTGSGETSIEVRKVDIRNSMNVPVEIDEELYSGRREIEISGNRMEIPGAYELHQNYPNPFNPATTISFSLPVESEYRLSIYNVNGQHIKSFSGSAGAGVVEISWIADGCTSGVYFYRLQAGSFIQTRKMILMR